ncbi:MAG: enoyl-CoA hydratase/isomerase family protein, partial [Vicinamibacteria bacterium]|nr:enoyl-CoA hydratase/isomerase family protein [Vicinamibacteria bacterium]
MTVNLERRGKVAVLTIDHPPVNALGAAVKKALRDRLRAALADPSVTAIVIAGAGRHFSAGADLKEFSDPATIDPTLPEVIDLIESGRKPVVAALHGTVAGGALELALGCHYRLAEEGAQMTLPEVTLGLLPGAGGTARLPRLVGVEAALDLILKGRCLGAEEAAPLGLVDEAVPARTVRERAIAFAAKVSRTEPRRTRDLFVVAPAADLLARIEADLARTARGRKAPQAAFDCVKRSLSLPFAEALALERKAFLELMGGAESRGLRHVFFAEREAQKAGELKKGQTLRAIRSVGVVGFGTMGSGIAMAFANASMPVVVTDETQEAVDRGLARVRTMYEDSRVKGRISGDESTKRIGLIQGATDHAALSQVDLVIEAVFEEMELKLKVFRRLDEICSDKAIFATNTSSLDVNAIAEQTKDPSRVLGLHFFSPANIMKLVEVVRPATVSASVLASSLDVVKRIGKIGVVVGVCDGFVGNRMLYAYRRQADFLLEEGALPQQVDRALREFGMAMGPFQIGDLAGLDIGWRIRKRQAETRPKGLRYSPIADRLCEQGRFGQKTGAGWYRYG